MKRQTLHLSFDLPETMVLHPEDLGEFRTALLEILGAEMDRAGSHYGGQTREIIKAVLASNLKDGT